MTKQEDARDVLAIFLYNLEMSGKHTTWTLWLDLPEDRKYEYRCYALEALRKLGKKGVVIEADRKFPKKLTNNIGCMSKRAIRAFANKVLKECGYSHKMKWSTAGSLCTEDTIYIEEGYINSYPYSAKLMVLHEIAHIDTHPQDDRHGEIFHSRLAELINRFMAGSAATQPLIKEVSNEA